MSHELRRLLSRTVRVLAMLVLAAGAAVAAPQPSGPPPQGQSRTVAMTDLCGSHCDRLEKFSQCGVEGELLEGPAFDDRGNLYVVALRGGNVYRITPDGVCARFANTGGQPQSLKFHAGLLYGVDIRRGVFTIDPATGEVKDYLTSYRNQNFKGPNDLIFDEAGGFYFTDPWGSSTLDPEGAIYYVAPGPDKRITRLADNLAFPNGIALSPDGKTLYVAEFSAQRLLAIPLLAPGVPDLGFAHAAAYVAGGVGLDSMAIDDRGDVYVAHFGAGEVEVFDPRGFVVGAIHVAPPGGWNVTNVAFHGGYLYITEAEQRVVWRLPVKVGGAALH